MPGSSRSTHRSSDLGRRTVRECYRSSYQYERAQAYSDAIKALLSHYGNSPQSYTANLRLGWLHYLSGQYASAARHYQRAIKTAPDSIEAKLGYTLPLLAQGRYRDVETVTRQILEVDRGNYLANLRQAFALRMPRQCEVPGGSGGRNLCVSWGAGCLERIVSSIALRLKLSKCARKVLARIVLVTYSEGICEL